MAEIDKENLAQLARNLKEMLDLDSKYKKVNELRASLIPLLNDAMEYKIDKPIHSQNIPGNCDMHRLDTFDNFHDLSSAYAKFVTEISGNSDAPGLKWLREQYETQNKKIIP